MNRFIFVTVTALLFLPLQSYGSNEREWDLNGGILRAVATGFEYPFFRMGKAIAISPKGQSPIKTVKLIYQAGGLREFYTGGVSYVLRKGPQWLYRGYIKEYFEVYSDPLKDHPYVGAFTLGSIFGVLDGFTECASDRYNTVVTTVKKPRLRFKKYHPFIVYKGGNNISRTIRITPKFLFGTLRESVYSNALSWCGFLGFWEAYKGVFSDEDGKLSMSRRVLVASLSGVSSSLISSPYHFRLIHLQGVNTFQPKGFVRDLRYLVLRYGYGSLARFMLLRAFGAMSSAPFTGMLFMK